MNLYFTEENFYKEAKKTPFAFSCNEGMIYIIKNSDNYKVYKIFNPYNMDNELSLETIKYLIENKKYIKSPSLVLPKDLVYIDNSLEGFTMDFVKGINLTNYLRKITISNNTKIDILKSLGKILEDLKNNTPNIHIGDLHPGNFIVTKNKELKSIDPNGYYIDGFTPRNSKYLVTSQVLYSQEKYKFTSDNTCIPSYQTDIYCYIMLILSFIGNATIYKARIELIKDYLSYLKSLGIDYRLIDAFSTIYKKEENVNPYNLLDKIKGYNSFDTSFAKYLKIKNI